jgi:hypothetical protein
MREGMVRAPLLWTPRSDGVVFSRAYDRGVSLWFTPLSGTARQVTESMQRERERRIDLERSARSSSRAGAP